jgi:putative endonuclease
MNWYVYVILTMKGKLYTGISTDPERRFYEHLFNPKKGAKFFRSDSPEKIVYCESFENMSLALKKEAEIKRWPASKKRSSFLASFSQEF